MILLFENEIDGDLSLVIKIGGDFYLEVKSNSSDNLEVIHEQIHP